jgi:Arc-like DNA binding dprotein
MRRSICGITRHFSKIRPASGTDITARPSSGRLPTTLPLLVLKKRIVQTGLRISEELRDRLDREARKSGISLNSEMERRLAQSFDEAKRMKEVVDFMQDFMKYAVEHASEPDDATIEWMRQRSAKREAK